ncbi:glycoside hydrolase family 43 protein [Alteromonas aestuariivivens]|uniref:Glycoside hydrolase family 43 protein n=1 Tax=Alteromonas aestuariivivens TaxID=1938339 RepID=A0A3D8MEP8_9ALTE|nr:glycoside hydrolase family 43 protein [Alteromonas aestuariivivens]RDV29349.1 glycoside hydrolase family 43 protein [Alteromonas aestuariivivens]
MRLLATMVIVAGALTSASALGNSAETDVQKTFSNPILPGFHPDPSVTRVGDDYYLATSSFEWFPAVPIFHSKDLVNWELINYAVSKPEYLSALNEVEKSRGIYAPTLRYHDGWYYMITTCVKCGDNFYVKTQDPAGEWSAPVWIEGDRGIDPSLFWDDDGKVYYTGTGILDKSKADWINANGIWIQEIDLETGKLLGSKKQLTYGHAVNARWTEGPHIYKRDGYYYLMVAEGGTGEDHAVTIFRSESVTGPYVANYKNPLLTHRHLGSNSAIHSTGHADMIETQNGDWYAVMLGKRRFDGLSPLARESFLTPVSWEDGWPVFNPGVGLLQLEEVRPNLPWTPLDTKSARDDFDQAGLRKEYNRLRAQSQDWAEANNGMLSITLKPDQLGQEFQQPAMLVRRIQHPQYTASLKMKFSSENANEEAGLVIYRDYQHYYSVAKKANSLELTAVNDGEVNVLASIPYKPADAVIKVEDTGNALTFYVGESESALKVMAENVDASYTSDDSAGGFNGPMVGMYASANGVTSSSHAEFDWFEYQP